MESETTKTDVIYKIARFIDKFKEFGHKITILRRQNLLP